MSYETDVFFGSFVPQDKYVPILNDILFFGNRKEYTVPDNDAEFLEMFSHEKHTVLKAFLDDFTALCGLQVYSDCFDLFRMEFEVVESNHKKWEFVSDNPYYNFPDDLLIVCMAVFIAKNSEFQFKATSESGDRFGYRIVKDKSGKVTYFELRTFEAFVPTSMSCFNKLIFKAGGINEVQKSSH